MTYANFYRTQGRPPVHPFYELKPGESCTLQLDPNKIDCALHHIRKSRGWKVTSRKTGRYVEVTRHS